MIHITPEKEVKVLYFMTRATAFHLGQVIIDQACLDRMGDIDLCVCVYTEMELHVSRQENITFVSSKNG